jgi:hypothetical protein
MDLYGTNGNAIAMGNARMQAVRDFNERVKQHNADVADKIQSLREQESTADTIKQIKDQATNLWSAKDIPGKVAEYNKWVASRNAPNPTEGAGGAVAKGLAKEGENLVEDTALGKAIGKVGVLGSTALGGMDLYEDIKSKSIQGNNTWEKAGNLLQIGGTIGDMVGTVLPPAKLVGGVLDLASGITESIGEKLDEDKEADDLKTQQQAETQKTIGVAPQTIATGRVE